MNNSEYWMRPNAILFYMYCDEKKKKKNGNEMWKRLQCLRYMEINYTIMERLYVRNNMW